MEDFIETLKSNVEALRNIDLNADTDLLSLDCWDSVVLLSTMIAIEAEYGAGLSNDDITTCSSLRDLYNLTIKKAAEQSESAK